MPLQGVACRLHSLSEGFLAMQASSASCCLAAVCLAAALLVATSAPVAAQSTGTMSGEVEKNPVDPDFKGTIGLGLIGAELGFVIPALAGLRETWGYVVFPIVGAAGGGLAGYFAIEKGTDSAPLAVATLLTGMALIIPAMVVTLSETAYDPDEELPQAAAIRTGAPPALLRIEQATLRLGAPDVAFELGTGAGEPVVPNSRSARGVRVSLVSGRF